MLQDLQTVLKQNEHKSKIPHPLKNIGPNLKLTCYPSPHIDCYPNPREQSAFLTPIFRRMLK